MQTIVAMAVAMEKVTLLIGFLNFTALMPEIE